jgi:hypothetical protein
MMATMMATATPPRAGTGRIWRGLVLLFCVVVAIAAVLLPLLLLQPFRPQTPRELSIALALFRWSWVITGVALITVVVVLIRSWGRSRIWFKLAGCVAMGLVALACFAARQNVFEKMFAPVPQVQFLPAGTEWVTSTDTVLGVSLGGMARAYPVMELAYHHIVNDEMAGMPIVVTY